MWYPGLTLEDVEREVIKKAYSFYLKNKTQTASSLGISIRTLDAKLLSYEGNQNGNKGPGEQGASSAGDTSQGQTPVDVSQGSEPSEVRSEAGLCVEPNAKAGKKRPMPVRKRQKVQEVSPK